MADEPMDDAEFAQAQARVRAEQARRDAMKAEAEAARLAPIRAITESNGFEAVLAAVTAIPIELRADETLSSSIQAIRAGMENLRRLVPPLPPEAAS